MLENKEQQQKLSSDEQSRKSQQRENEEKVENYDGKQVDVDGNKVNFISILFHSRESVCCVKMVS